MSFLNSLDISGSALTAQRFRMDIISQNVANANTTRTESGGPYRRKMVVLQENGPTFDSFLNSKTDIEGLGVSVNSVVEDQSDLKRIYDPSHPDADENGYVLMPNVDTTQEIVDMISATRSYEANVTVFNAVKAMASRALDIGR